MGELQPRRRDRATEGTSYVEAAVGLVFVLAAAAHFASGLTSGVFYFGFPLLLAAAWLLGRALQDATGHGRALPQSVGKERELLAAIRDNGGVATAAEATMSTSLGVKEAERMLSELAAGGHLRVEVEGPAGRYRTVSSIGAETYDKTRGFLRGYPQPVTLWRWRNSRIPRMPSWRCESSATTA